MAASAAWQGHAGVGSACKPWDLEFATRNALGSAASVQWTGRGNRGETWPLWKGRIAHLLRDCCPAGRYSDVLFGQEMDAYSLAELREHGGYEARHVAPRVWAGC